MKIIVFSILIHRNAYNHLHLNGGVKIVQVSVGGLGEQLDVQWDLSCSDFYFPLAPSMAGAQVYVCVTHCQADARYDVKNRNNQCTAMTVFFLCYGSLNPLQSFNAQKIDDILLQGDQLYGKSFDTFSKEEQGHP